MDNNKSLKIYITVHPKPLKLLLAFKHGTLISEVKQKINDILVDMKLQHICDKLTNDKEYILDNDNVII